MYLIIPDNYKNDVRNLKYLVRMIDNGSTRAKRGMWEIGIGGYDQGYILSYNGFTICEINYEYMEIRFPTNETDEDDEQTIKEIFESDMGEPLKIVN